MSVFSYLERAGLESLDNSSRIGQIRNIYLREHYGAEKYLFLPSDATIYQIRSAFEDRSKRNNRLSAVFITKSGSQNEPLIAMLTPWDVLKDSANMDA